MGIIPGFGLSLGSSLITGAVNNRYAQENAAAQREWQEAMWSRENAYNTPAAMSHRMREAGLNPYTMTGAEPAGSVGTGAQAQTIPFENPMANLTQVAQVENLASSTDKNLNESDRILLQIERDKVALQMELISKEEYEFRFKKYQEAYKELNPFTLEAENKQADTALKTASASSATADAALSTALGITENLLRDLRAENLGASTDDLRARANNFRESSKNLLESTKSMSRENAIQAYNQEISRFFYMPDITILPAELQAKAAEYYADFVNGKFTYESTVHALYQQIDRYIEKNGHISTSVSESGDFSAGNKYLYLSGGKSTSVSR